MRIEHVIRIFVFCTLVAFVAIYLQKQAFSSEGDKKEAYTNNLIKMATLGGLKDSHSQSSQNSNEIDALAVFAVQEHNKKENALLEFSRVVKAQSQVVAGTLHHLTLEVVETGKKKLYLAKIWEKPWLNFKELQEFKHVEDVPSHTASDLGALKGDGPSVGSHSVPVHDPVIEDVAKHAVKTIQQRSNSLFPYELLEIVNANAEIGEDRGATKYDLLLKLKRGDKEEKYKVKVHQSTEGALHLNHMEQDHS